MYVCHGAPYAKCEQLKIGHVGSDKIADVLAKTETTPSLPARCLACGATHCALCHVTGLSGEVKSIS